MKTWCVKKTKNKVLFHSSITERELLHCSFGIFYKCVELYSLKEVSFSLKTSLCFTTSCPVSPPSLCECEALVSLTAYLCVYFYEIHRRLWGGRVLVSVFKVQLSVLRYYKSISQSVVQVSRPHRWSPFTIQTFKQMSLGQRQDVVVEFQLWMLVNVRICGLSFFTSTLLNLCFSVWGVATRMVNLCS